MTKEQFDHVLRWLVYKLCHVVATLSMGIFFPVRVTGARCVPKTGRILVVGNHQSFLDPVVLGMTLPRKPQYIARATLFRFGPFAWFIQTLGAIAIKQEGSAKEGLQASLAHLDTEGALALWPEGSRTPDGELKELQPGIMLLLKRAAAPVVVFGIAGAFESWPLHGKFIYPRPICIHYRQWRYNEEADREVNLRDLRDAIQDAVDHAQQLRQRMLDCGRGRLI